jgi:hypothetical protein
VRKLAVLIRYGLYFTNSGPARQHDKDIGG